MFRSFTVLFLATLLVLPCTAAFAAQDVPPEVQAMFQEGWELEKQMHLDPKALDKAEAIFTEAIKLAPNSDEAHWRMGEILFKQADNNIQDKEGKEAMFKKALEYSMKALEINPKSVGGTFWSGSINGKLAELSGLFSALGNVKAAKKHFHATIENHPEHRFATLSYSILAAIYSSTPWPLKDMDKALEYAKIGVERDERLTMASVELAKVYIKLKEYDKAKAELKRCIAVEVPTYIWDSQLKNWPKAEELLKEIEGK